MKRIVVFGSVAPFLAAVLASCSSSSQPQGIPPTEVPVITVSSGDGVLQTEYSCAIEGIVNVEIRPQISGYLRAVLVDEGAFVRAGQTLFQIDDRLYTEQYNTAKAAVLTAEAALKTATIDFDRNKALAANGVVSDLQTTESAARLQSANAAVAQAKAAAESARINLEFCTIKAPVSGYIGRFPYRLGSLVGPTSPTALTVLSDIHRVYAYFSMSEADFNAFQTKFPGKTLEEKIAGADSVRLLKSTGEPHPLKGKIDAIGGQFDRNTGAISVRAVFGNPSGELRSGNTGRISIAQTHQNVALVPITATQAVQDKIFVFSIDSTSRAVQKPIEIIGKSEANYMVSEGVQPGDQVISAGIDRLQHGMPVVVQQPQAHADATGH